MQESGLKFGYFASHPQVDIPGGIQRGSVLGIVNNANDQCMRNKVFH